MTSPRVSVYVDGFNLYYGALKPNPALKWLDLHALAERLAPGSPVAVRYFTAQVKPLPTHPAAAAKQRLYFRALETTPIRIHLGHFITKPTNMPVDAPGTKLRFAQVLKTEEKGSDVNLATWLLLDGFDGLYDEAIVISDDSDLAEPVAQAARRFGPIHVVSPRGMRLAALNAASTSCRTIDLAMLAACQLPSPLVLSSGRTIVRPPDWV